MDFLYFLEGIRTPFLNCFFSLVTHLGEETFFIVIALLVFWCVDKNRGYLILAVGFFGTVINQFLKLAFRVDRPWIRDSNFTIVESAREAATGFSFPSGHTQNAVGTFGAIGATSKPLYVKVLCFLIIILVPFSRMYLGVHTPSDVIVSLIISVLLVLILIPAFTYIKNNPNAMYLLLGTMLFFSSIFLIYVLLNNFPLDINEANLASGRKDASSLFGMVMGICIAYPLEKRYVKFDTHAIILAQALKLIIGLAFTLALKSGLKTLFAFLFGFDTILPNIVRYAVIVIFAVAVWPLTFKLFSRLGNKNHT